MNDKDILKFLDLDLESFKTILDNSKKIETDEKFFASLSAIVNAKNLIKDALDDIESYESQAKGQINAKAKALYGQDWTVIAGEHFKISRSPVGQLYEVTDPDKVDAEYVTIKISPNSRTIETYRESHDNTIPEGIAINEQRTESIRVAIK